MWTESWPLLIMNQQFKSWSAQISDFSRWLKLTRRIGRSVFYEPFSQSRIYFIGPKLIMCSSFSSFKIKRKKNNYVPNHASTTEIDTFSKLLRALLHFYTSYAFTFHHLSKSLNCRLYTWKIVRALQIAFSIQQFYEPLTFSKGHFASLRFLPSNALRIETAVFVLWLWKGTVLYVDDFCENWKFSKK
mgnify:CR=1 FL=1